MKKILITGLLFITIITTSSCSKKQEPTIIGKWVHEDYTYTFNEDKTCTYEFSITKIDCTYELNGDRIAITFSGNTIPFETTYSLEENKLSIKDSFGENTIYDKR